MCAVLRRVQGKGVIVFILNSAIKPIDLSLDWDIVFYGYEAHVDL